MEDLITICNDNKKMIIFFDIDDTLFAPKIGIPQSAVEAINKLRENGHMTFICTGRSRSMVSKSMMDIGFDGIVAGAGTYIEYQGKVLSRNDLEEKEAWDIVTKLREIGFIPVPEGHDNLYYEKEENWTEKYKNIYGKYHREIQEAMLEIPKDGKGLNVAKISAVFTEKSNFEEAVAVFGDRYTVINHKNALMELIPKGFSKAVGIESVIKLLDIPWENTCAFGDSMNDYEMLDYVNYSVAMGNSQEEIKKLAKYVTDDVEHDGIYNGLKRLGLI